MKNYRLIKKYPSSPELGVIYNEDNFIGDFGYGVDFEKYTEFWQEVKEPLFTTFDGVDIFKGDYYYPVEKLYYFLHTKQTNNHCTNEEKFWIFSIKEKAEEYIKLNKPQYSLNDMVKIANHWAYIKTVTPEYVLKTVEKWTIEQH